MVKEKEGISAERKRFSWEERGFLNLGLKSLKVLLEASSWLLKVLMLVVERRYFVFGAWCVTVYVGSQALS